MAASSSVKTYCASRKNRSRRTEPQAQRERQDAEHVEGDLDLQRPIQADDVLDEDEPLQHRRVDGDDRKAERLCRIIPGNITPRISDSQYSGKSRKKR